MMKKGFRYISVLGITFLMTCVLTISSVFGSERIANITYMPFGTIEELTKESNVIIQGTILEERTELVNLWEGVEDRPSDLDDLYDPWTIYTVQVDEVFKGNVTLGSTIEVQMLGGEYGGVVLTNRSKIPLSVGEKYILFLTEIEVESSVQSFVAPVPHQSIYELNENGDIAQGGFELTREALDQIQAENIANNDGFNLIWILTPLLILVPALLIAFFIYKKRKKTQSLERK